MSPFLQQTLSLHKQLVLVQLVDLGVISYDGSTGVLND